MRTITAPEGQTWSVKRHWISRRPRWRGREFGEIGDVPDLFSWMDDSPIALIVGLIVAVALLLFFTGFLAFFIEIVVIVVALVVTLTAKVLFRRPWYVEAAPADKPELTRRWAVVGWKRSNEVMDELARSIEAGTPFLSPHARELEVELAANERAAPKGGS